jgi:hypothetical protein
MPNHIGNGIEFRQRGKLLEIIQCYHAIRTQAFRLHPLTGTNACNYLSAMLSCNMHSRSTDPTDYACNENDLTRP